MFQTIKTKIQNKKYDKIRKMYPLWNYQARKEGFVDWQAYVIFYKILDEKTVENINKLELLKGAENNGGKSVFWSASDWQDYFTCKDGLYKR